MGERAAIKSFQKKKKKLGEGRRKKNPFPSIFGTFPPVPSPNHQRRHAKNGKLSRNMCTLRTSFFFFLHVSHRFCVLSRCLEAKISASELGRKFVKSELLVGQATGEEERRILCVCVCVCAVLPFPPSSQVANPISAHTKKKIFFSSPSRKRRRGRGENNVLCASSSSSFFSLPLFLIKFAHAKL